MAGKERLNPRPEECSEVEMTLGFANSTAVTGGNNFTGFTKLREDMPLFQGDGSGRES